MKHKLTRGICKIYVKNIPFTHWAYANSVQPYYKRLTDNASLALKFLYPCHLLRRHLKICHVCSVLPWYLFFPIQQQSRSCTEGQFTPSTSPPATTQWNAEGSSSRLAQTPRDIILIFDFHMQLYAILDLTHTIGVAAVWRFLQAFKFRLRYSINCCATKVLPRRRKCHKAQKKPKLSCFTSLSAVTSLLPHISTTQLKTKPEETRSTNTHWMLHKKNHLLRKWLKSLSTLLQSQKAEGKAVTSRFALHPGSQCSMAAG